MSHTTRGVHTKANPSPIPSLGGYAHTQRTHTHTPFKTRSDFPTSLALLCADKSQPRHSRLSFRPFWRLRRHLALRCLRGRTRDHVIDSRIGIALRICTSQGRCSRSHGPARSFKRRDQPHRLVCIARPSPSLANPRSQSPLQLHSTFNHGRVCESTDFRHLLRDYESVRSPRAVHAAFHMAIGDMMMLIRC